MQEKKNEPGATVTRTFYLQNRGFYESSRWDDTKDSDADSVVSYSDSDSDLGSDGWDSDDSDRPCIKNVTATLQQDAWL